MKFEFNSNTVMAVIMFISLLAGGYTYIEGQINEVDDRVSAVDARVTKESKDSAKRVADLEIPGAYDDKDLMKSIEAVTARVTALEAVNVQKELAVINQKLADIKPYDPTAINEAVNEIKVQIAKIETKLAALGSKNEVKQ